MTLAVIHTPGVILVNPLPVFLVVLGRAASWGALILDHLIHGTGVYQRHYHFGQRPLPQVLLLHLRAYTPMQRVFVHTGYGAHARFRCAIFVFLPTFK